MKNQEFTTITSAELSGVSGGFDWGSILGSVLQGAGQNAQKGGIGHGNLLKGALGGLLGGLGGQVAGGGGKGGGGAAPAGGGE